MKILSIGNSFSEDAHAYLKGVCDSRGLEITCCNLYIGGCTLIRHHKNMLLGLKAYTYIVNGVPMEKGVSMEDALTREKWDVVTLQEHSIRACDKSHFEPYIYELIDYVKRLCPNVKIGMQMSWGYTGKFLNEMRNAGIFSTEEMFDRIEENNLTIAKQANVDILIPSGRVLRRLYDLGYNIHRDNQHTSLGIGRYALALTWMRALFGARATGNPFRDFDAFVSREEIDAAQTAVDELVTDFIQL